MLKPEPIQPWDVSYRKNTWLKSMKIMGRALGYLPLQFAMEVGGPFASVLLGVLLLVIGALLFLTRPFVILAAGLCGYLSEPVQGPPDINKEKLA